LSRSYDPDLWLDSPQGTKAYYSLQTNEIVFPAGILQKPLYDIDNPAAVNYGALGTEDNLYVVLHMLHHHHHHHHQDQY